MNKYYPHLFSPIFVNGKRFRNRILAAPTLSSQLTEEGYLSELNFTCFESKARGGAAAVTLGETAVDWDYAKTHYSQINIWGEKAGVQLANMSDAIHHWGALASIELCHGGVWSNPEFIGGKNPIGPSKTVRPDGVVVEEMTEAQILQVVENFAEAVAICKRCGYDMAMLHAGHGWLLGAFVSPFDNKRTDKYGGTLENRARVPLMVLDRIREKVGTEFLLDMRFSVSEGIEGGIEPDEAVAFVKLAEKHGLNIISQSYGTRWSTDTRGRCTPSSFYDYGCNLEYARALKKGGVSIPVAALGSLDDPELANEAIARGDCDFITLGRAFVADPDYANKVRLGKADEVIKCIKCSKYCGDIPIGRDNNDAILRINHQSTHRFGCAVNPRMGRLHYPPIPKIPSRNVCVIGGGPAGMQAALTAAENGHKVTLLERSSSLGGALKFADTVPFKKFIKLYKEYLIRMMTKCGVDVRLNVDATPEYVSNGKFDTVIAALGAEPIVPDITGIDKNNVYMALESYNRANEMGKRIVIIGGGQVGAETALHFARLGHNVTVIEMADLVARDASFTHRVQLMERLEKEVTCITNSRCTEINNDGVNTIKNDGTNTVYPADSIIIAVGFKPRSDEAEKFFNCAPDFILAGDCMLAKDIGHATTTGYDAAIQIV